MVFTRCDLLSLVLKKVSPTDATFRHETKECLQAQMKKQIADMSPKEQAEIDHFIDYFSKFVPQFWRQSSRNRSRMIAKHYEFFSTEIVFNLLSLKSDSGDAPAPEFPVAAQGKDVPHTPKKKKPRTSFRSLSASQQFRGAATVRNSAQHDGAVIKAAAQNFRRMGHHDAGYVVDCLQANPEKGRILKKTLNSSSHLQNMTPEEALSILYDRNMTRNHYMKYREDINRFAGRKVAPSYTSIQSAKKYCRPEGIKVSEDQVVVPLKSTLDHTFSRILEDTDVRRKLEELSCTGPVSLTFFYKYGLDGSRGHGQFNQACASLAGDGSLMATHMVPLQIVAHIKKKLIVLYSNGLCNSSLACRPLCYWSVPETKENLDIEIARLQEEVDQLLPFQWAPNVTVSYQGFMALCDGKVVNNKLDNPSSQRCPFCLATPKQMSDPDGIFLVNPEAYNMMCLSVLHFGLRSFEFILNLGYNQEFKQYQARGAKLRDKRLKMKQKVHDQFFEKLGLRIGEPRDGGAGTSNTGNTARKAYENSDFFAEVCNVPVELVRGLHHLWIALSCCLPLDPLKFEEKCKEVLAAYFKSCSWYLMPPTVHKILAHGREFLEMLPSTITCGMLSEEGSESSNKDLKYFQINHARQTSRQNRSQDVFERAMDRSDPKILSYLVKEKLKMRAKKVLPKEVIAMLKEPEIASPSDDDDSVDDTDEDLGQDEAEIDEI